MQVLVQPPVAQRALGTDAIGHLPADERHRAERCAHRAGTDIAVLRGKALLPDVGRLDDVVVNRNDPRYFSIAHYSSTKSRAASPVRTLRKSLPVALRGSGSERTSQCDGTL